MNAEKPIVKKYGLGQVGMFINAEKPIIWSRIGSNFSHIIIGPVKTFVVG